MATANRTRKFQPKPCASCAAEFEPRSGRHSYCSSCTPEQHRKYPTPCTRCGTMAMKYPSKRYKQFCGTDCRDAYMRELPKKPKQKPVRAPYDPRSPMRIAVESGDHSTVLRIIQERSAITDDGCWKWQGRMRDGYAYINLGGKYTGVHRISLEARLQASLGDQPAHHTCANTACVNPDHLQAVTHRENIAEMLARNYMERRIVALEDALSRLDPQHPLLAEVSVLR